MSDNSDKRRTSPPVGAPVGKLIRARANSSASTSLQDREFKCLTEYNKRIAEEKKKEEPKLGGGYKNQEPNLGTQQNKQKPKLVVDSIKNEQEGELLHLGTLMDLNRHSLMSGRNSRRKLIGMERTRWI